MDVYIELAYCDKHSARKVSQYLRTKEFQHYIDV